MPASPGSKPRTSRGSADPALLDDWEANAYASRRRQRAIAANTIVDDTLPDDPWLHPAETRAALELLAD